MTVDHFPYAAIPDLSGNRVEASNSTLLRQAPMTADTYMSSAIACIDERFGKGYAKAHPELVGAFMQTSSIDLGTAVIARALQLVADAIESSGNDVVEALQSD